MAALDLGMFSSKQFIFVIGEKRAEFAVHAAIIAKQSKALDVLINGPMKEASDGKAIFDDIQEDDFERFCQFAYTGNYTTPNPIHIPAVELLGVPPFVVLPHVASAIDRDDSRSTEQDGVPEIVLEPDVENAWGVSPQKSKKPKKPSKSRLLRQSFDNQHYNTETAQTFLAARCEVCSNSSPTENFTAVFLRHAQLYVFAEKWGIVTLKTLVLSKLHETLASFTLYAARRPDIVELLRYAYSNDHTPDRVSVDVVDDLRSLVILYAVCEAENLTHCPEFVSLIGEGGQLAQDFVQLLMKRIE